jgi:hypothetical protein
MTDSRTYQLLFEIGSTVEKRRLEASSNPEAMKMASAILVTQPPGTTGKLIKADGMIIWWDSVD